MKNEQLFEEFEDVIEAKYGHMAEDMLSFFDELTIFFEEENLDVNKFTKKQIDTLVEDYLDFEGLTDAECSMIFQTLIDFCDFCISKKINYNFFKRYLEEEQYELYEWWGEEELLFPEEDDFPEITSDDIMENFDSFYNIMKLTSKKEKADIPNILRYLENLYDISQTGYETAQKLREKFPDITEEELAEECLKAIDKKLMPPYEFENIEKSALLLPREQAKKFYTIVYNMEKTDGLKPGSIKKKKAAEEALATLKELIDDLKKMKGKKKSKK